MGSGTTRTHATLAISRRTSPKICLLDTNEQRELMQMEWRTRHTSSELSWLVTWLVSMLVSYDCALLMFTHHLTRN